MGEDDNETPDAGQIQEPEHSSVLKILENIMKAELFWGVDCRGNIPGTNDAAATPTPEETQP